MLSGCSGNVVGDCPDRAAVLSAAVCVLRQCCRKLSWCNGSAVRMLSRHGDNDVGVCPRVTAVLSGSCPGIATTMSETVCVMRKRCQGLSGDSSGDVRFCPTRKPILSGAVRIKAPMSPCVRNKSKHAAIMSDFNKKCP